MDIYNSIKCVMEEVGAIGKDKRNAQQNFKYRGVDDVMNALQPALIKNGVFVVPKVLEHRYETRGETSKGNPMYAAILKIEYTFYASDGSHVEATVIGEAMDTADKASNKAMSVAFKYACFQVLCIPTEEMLDPDAETPEPAKKVVKAVNTERPAAKTAADKTDKDTALERALNYEIIIKDQKRKLGDASVEWLEAAAVRPAFADIEPLIQLVLEYKKGGKK